MNVKLEQLKSSKESRTFQKVPKISGFSVKFRKVLDSFGPLSINRNQYQNALLKRTSTKKMLFYQKEEDPNVTSEIKDPI